MNKVSKIPTQRPHFTKEEPYSIWKVLESRWIGLGTTTLEFEQKLQKMFKANYVIAVNSGTSALHIALEALIDTYKIKPGSEVIVPSLTFAATIQAIVNSNLTPVFCDVQKNNLNMDPKDLVKRITSKTKVIMPVHYGGVACDMNKIISIAKKHGIFVVEDAAHAFGSTYKGKPIGTWGDITCFSFDPIKNITCGEGGAVVTNDNRVAENLTLMRILGISKDTWSRYKNKRLWFYDVSSRGFRYHMPNLNAAIGLVQLKRFKKYQDRKRKIVELYDKLLTKVNGITLLEHNLKETFPFFYVIRVLNGKRNKLMEFLNEEGVEVGIHYIPNHLQSIFSKYKTSLPITEQSYDEILTLPLFYEMTDKQIRYVIDKIKEFFRV